jgi:uncharacterized protein (UPF0297 family)
LENVVKGDQRGRRRFTLEDSIEVDVKEIMYDVIGCIQDYGNKAMKQWIAYICTYN